MEEGAGGIPGVGGAGGGVPPREGGGGGVLIEIKTVLAISSRKLESPWQEKD